MPAFRWKGRTRDGHEVEGRVDARSKEQVVDGLRRNGITIISMTEGSAGSSEPADPDRGTTALKSESSSLRIFVVLLLVAAALIGALIYFGKLHIP